MDSQQMIIFFGGLERSEALLTQPGFVVLTQKL